MGGSELWMPGEATTIKGNTDFAIGTQLMKLYWMRDSDGIATIAKMSCFSQTNYRMGSDYMSLGIQNRIKYPQFLHLSDF